MIYELVQFIVTSFWNELGTFLCRHEKFLRNHRICRKYFLTGKNYTLNYCKIGVRFWTPKAPSYFFTSVIFTKSNYYVYLCLLFFVFYILCYLFNNGFSLLSLICWICYGFISFFCVYYGFNSVAYLIFSQKLFYLLLWLFIYLFIYLFIVNIYTGYSFQK